MSRRPSAADVPGEASRLAEVLSAGLRQMSTDARTKQVKDKNEKERLKESIAKTTPGDDSSSSQALQAANAVTVAIMTESAEAEALEAAEKAAMSMMPIVGTEAEAYAVLAVAIYKLCDEFALVEEYGDPALNTDFYNAMNTFMAFAQIIDAQEKQAASDVAAAAVDATQPTPATVGAIYDRLPGAAKAKAKVRFTNPSAPALFMRFFAAAAVPVQAFRRFDLLAMKDWILDMGPIIQGLLIFLLEEQQTFFGTTLPGQGTVNVLERLYSVENGFDKVKQLFGDGAEGFFATVKVGFKTPLSFEAIKAGDALKFTGNSQSVFRLLHSLVKSSNPFSGSYGKGIGYGATIVSELWKSNKILPMPPQWRFAVYITNLCARLMLRVQVYTDEFMFEWIKLNNEQVCNTWKADLQGRLLQLQQPPAQLNQANASQANASIDQASGAWILALLQLNGYPATVDRPREKGLLDKKPLAVRKGVRFAYEVLSTGISSFTLPYFGWIAQSASAFAAASGYWYSSAEWRKEVILEVNKINDSIGKMDTLDGKFTEAETAAAAGQANALNAIFGPP